MLQAFPDGLTTAEVALIMTQDKYTADLNKAEDSLIAAIDAEAATRLPFGHDALWVPPAPVASRSRPEQRRGAAGARRPQNPSTESSSTA